MKKTLVLLLTAILLVGIFVACGNNSAPPSESAPPAVTQDEGDSEGSTAAAATEEGYKIAFTRNFYGNSWTTQYEQAVRSRFEEYKAMGVVSDYTYVACNADVTEQLNQLNALLQEDYDLIMIDAVSPTSLTGFIEEANAKGVQIIFGTTNSPYEGIPCFATDYSVYGRSEAYYLCEKIGGKGNIIEIHGVAGDPNCDLFTLYAHQVYEMYDINILASGNGFWNDADAQTETATLLASYGDQIDAVFCEDGMAYGIVNAFLNAGRPLVPMGGDYFKSFVDYWYENQDVLDTLVVPNSPYAMGHVIVDCAVYSAAGYKPAKFSQNPLEESISNWVPLSMPYLIFEKEEMDPFWLAEFPDTKVLSIEEAYQIMQGKEETAAIELYFDDDYVASLFGLDESLWW